MSRRLHQLKLQLKVKRQHLAIVEEQIALYALPTDVSVKLLFARRHLVTEVEQLEATIRNLAPVELVRDSINLLCGPTALELFGETWTDDRDALLTAVEADGVEANLRTAARRFAGGLSLMIDDVRLCLRLYRRHRSRRIFDELFDAARRLAAKLLEIFPMRELGLKALPGLVDGAAC